MRSENIVLCSPEQTVNFPDSIALSQATMSVAYEVDEALGLTEGYVLPLLEAMLEFGQVSSRRIRWSKYMLRVHNSQCDSQYVSCLSIHLLMKIDFHLSMIVSNNAMNINVQISI